MFKSIGAQPFLLPAPAFLVGCYDKNNKPNIMTAAWGGICASVPPAMSVSLQRTRWSHHGIAQHKAFSLNIPSVDMAAQVDFAGIVSGAKEDKFSALGYDATPCDNVDAPYVAQCPVVIELALINTVEIGSHTQYIGEVMDVKVRDDCFQQDGLPDLEKINPLCFAPVNREYWSMGSLVAKAFAIGKTIVRTTK